MSNVLVMTLSPPITIDFLTNRLWKACDVRVVRTERLTDRTIKLQNAMFTLWVLNHLSEERLADAWAYNPAWVHNWHDTPNIYAGYWTLHKP